MLEVKHPAVVGCTQTTEQKTSNSGRDASTETYIMNWYLKHQVA